MFKMALRCLIKQEAHGYKDTILRLMSIKSKTTKVMACLVEMFLPYDS